MLFASQFERTLDAKNRIVMPPKHKECLEGDSFVLCCLPNENFIRVYKNTYWEDLMNEHLFVDDGVDRTALQRYMFLNSANCNLDGQSRFTINPKFAKRVKIDKDVVLLGVGHRIEIWAKEVFDAQLPSLEKVSDMAKMVFPS